jgi:hypothetical protein
MRERPLGLGTPELVCGDTHFAGAVGFDADFGHLDPPQAVIRAFGLLFPCFNLASSETRYNVVLSRDIAYSCNPGTSRCLSSLLNKR